MLLLFQMISRVHVIPTISVSLQFAISYSHKPQKMAAKYPDSNDSRDILDRTIDEDDDFDISLEISDSEAACVADWSLCGDEKSTVTARPPAVNAISAPDSGPTHVEASIAAPRRRHRILTDDERLVHNALERAGYLIDPCEYESWRCKLLLKIVVSKFRIFEPICRC